MMHFSYYFSGCEVKCLENYALPDKTITLSIRCEDGSWKMGKWDRTPDCERNLPATFMQSCQLD